MKLAADANVLLSALIGGRARDVLTHPGVEEVLTVPSVLEEVREYLDHLARKKHLSLDLLLMTLATLPVTIVAPREYRGSLDEARRRMGPIDPDDVELLALALQRSIPVWSNGDDFRDIGVEWYTTARLLAHLSSRAR